MKIIGRLLVIALAAALFAALPSLAFAADAGNLASSPAEGADGISEVEPVDISTATVRLPHASYVYTGKKIKPKPVVRVAGEKLKAGRDYKVSYKSNRKIGVARVVVAGTGGYIGARTVAFKIVDWVTKLKVAKKKKQLIVVEVHGKRAFVTMHVKSKGFWRKKISTKSGWIGSNGLGRVREGSRRTPRGVMYPDKAFGIRGNPGCKMGYLKVDWSHYWCCDSNSPLYNKLVSTRDRTDFDYSASEHLISCGRVYNYCLNMGWNKKCVPYGGSAFFLHCSAGKPTAGCVTVPESTMKRILRTVKRGCAIVIDKKSRLKRY